MKTCALLPLTLLSLLLPSGCNKGDPLPGGYAIFFADSEDVGLAVPPKGEVLVGPKLAQIGNSGTLIFGEVQPPRKPNPSLVGSRTPGFFVLDSSTGIIAKGLSRGDWSKKLQTPIFMPPHGPTPDRVITLSGATGGKGDGNHESPPMTGTSSNTK